MRAWLLTLILFLHSTTAPAECPLLDQGQPVHAGTGEVILSPLDRPTYEIVLGDKVINIPKWMVYVPAGETVLGDGKNAFKQHVESFCIDRFSVTNAQYHQFLQDTPQVKAPRYWRDGNYPAGKANHPVVYVSLNDAKAYASWMASKTGWDVRIPTSTQWEKAARGPKGFLYPWGDSMDTSYRGGKLTTRFNYNAVTVADVLSSKANQQVKYDNPKSPYYGKTAVASEIMAFNSDGRGSMLSLSPNGSVRGWVSHDTYTGFIYTDLFSSLSETGGNTTPVGFYESGKSGYGCFDMAGNVWNWCDTQIVATNGAERGRTVNEIRGGSWYANGTSCKSIGIGEGRAARGAYNTVGFRVVMIPVAEANRPTPEVLDGVVE